jgi:hypothetical protein
MPSFSKATLMQMNNSHLGKDWIRNIANIKETETANIHPTWDAGLCGRMYVALPTDLPITPSVKDKWNLM